jgi:hypothetical protein
MGNIDQRYAIPMGVRKKPTADHTTAIDYISQLEGSRQSMRSELAELRQRDIERQAQLVKLEQQLIHFQRQQSSGGYDTSSGPGFSNHYPQHPVEPPRTLPPLMNGTGPTAMQGIQYSEDRR